MEQINVPSRLASGVTGELRVGYQVAARLGAWGVDGTPDGRWSFTGRLVESNAYWIESPGPFTLRLEIRLASGPRYWQWRGLSITERSPQSITIHGNGSPEVL